jgi:hypothetical protein
MKLIANYSIKIFQPCIDYIYENKNFDTAGRNNLPAGMRENKNNQGGIINENQQQHYGAKHSSPTFHQ